MYKPLLKVSLLTLTGLSLLACNANLGSMSGLLRASTSPAAVSTAMIATPVRGYGGGAPVTGANTQFDADDPEVNTESLTVITPTKAGKNNIVKVSIHGLNLLSDDVAKIYAGDCEVMAIANYGRFSIHSISTNIQLPATTDNNVTIKVLTEDKEASSKPIKLSGKATACDKKQGFSSSKELSLMDKKKPSDSKNIKFESEFKGGVAKLHAEINNPAEKNHITNMSLVINNKETVTVRTTPLLGNNPKFTFVMSTLFNQDKVTLLLKDNKSNIENHSLVLKSTAADHISTAINTTFDKNDPELNATKLEIKTPSRADKNNVVLVNITGLNLQTDEFARIYADECEVMAISNYGAFTVRNISTSIQLPNASSGSATIHVIKDGTKAQSKPIKLAGKALACQKTHGFSQINELSLVDRKKDKHSEKITLQSQFNGGIAKLQATIKHPMNKNHITNMSLLINNYEAITIRTTPLLGKDPELTFVISTLVNGDDITLLWRDNKSNLENNSLVLQGTVEE